MSLDPATVSITTVPALILFSLLVILARDLLLEVAEVLIKFLEGIL